MIKDILRCDTLNDLKEHPLAENALLFMLGYAHKDDGLGGVYYWDEESDEDEDLIYLTVIESDRVNYGRWIKVKVRERDFEQRVQLSEEQITDKKVFLSRPYAGGRIELVPDGFLSQRLGIDFEYRPIDNSVTWNNLGLHSTLKAGWWISIFYKHR